MSRDSSNRINLDDLLRTLEFDLRTGVFRWRISVGRVKAGEVAGTKSRYGYVVIRINGVQYAAHRLAWFILAGAWPEEEIDHINGDRLDNRATNLRLASRAQNCRNRRAIGVRFDPRCKNNPYLSSIGFKGEKIYLGAFRTHELARSAYREATKKYFGSFSRFDPKGLAQSEALVGESKE